MPIMLSDVPNVNNPIAPPTFNQNSVFGPMTSDQLGAIIGGCVAVLLLLLLLLLISILLLQRLRRKQRDFRMQAHDNPTYMTHKNVGDGVEVPTISGAVGGAEPTLPPGYGSLKKKNLFMEKRQTSVIALPASALGAVSFMASDAAYDEKNPRTFFEEFENAVSATDDGYDGSGYGDAGSLPRKTKATDVDGATDAIGDDDVFQNVDYDQFTGSAANLTIASLSKL